MNKSFFIALAALLLGGVGGVQAQQSKQKIGNNPYKITQPDAVLEIESTNKGVLLPRVALTATTSPAPLNAHVAGMVVYNTATAGDVTPGQYTNNGTAWVKNEATKTVGQDVVSDCTASGFSTVNLVKGVASSGLNFTVTLTNNTLSAAGPLGFATGDLVLSGANAGLTVSGVSPTTASITPGLSQVVTYTITGTPTGSGVLTGKWKKLSLSCDNTRNVAGTLVAALNCAGATFNTAFTDNTASYFTKIVLPYTGGNGGGYTTQTISSTGVTGMTATLAAGNLAVGAGNLTLTVSGTPSASGNADFSISIGGQTCTVSMEVWNFRTTNNGSTAALASLSCNAIKLANDSATDGTYYIDIDGVDNTYSAQQAYCDMTNDGGGWTLVAQWGSNTTATVVSSLPTTSTIGELSSSAIKSMSQFSNDVKLSVGSSASAISGKAVSSGTGSITALRSGGNLGTVNDYVVSGTVWPTFSAPAAVYVRSSMCDPGRTHWNPGGCWIRDDRSTPVTTTSERSTSGLSVSTHRVSVAAFTNSIYGSYWDDSSGWLEIGCDAKNGGSNPNYTWGCGNTNTTFLDHIPFAVSIPLGNSFRAVWLR